jgi:sulfotransferase
MTASADRGGTQTGTRQSQRTFYFIAGLPRSGSTLLCNILAQNPRFYATHTSGCIEILLTIRNYWDKCIEHRANLDWDALHRVLAASLETYHSTDRPASRL